MPRPTNRAKIASIKLQPKVSSWDDGMDEKVEELRELVESIDYKRQKEHNKTLFQSAVKKWIEKKAASIGCDDVKAAVQDITRLAKCTITTNSEG